MAYQDHINESKQKNDASALFYFGFAKGLVAGQGGGVHLLGRATGNKTNDRSRVTLRVRPHQGLSEAQRKAVERDYAMRNGVLKLKVRKAMEGYLRDRLGLTMADGKAQQKLLE